MKSLFAGLGAVGVVSLVVLVICIAPMLFLWSLNSLAELGGINFYIDHTLWSYFVSIVFIIVIRGGSK